MLSIEIYSHSLTSGDKSPFLASPLLLVTGLKKEVIFPLSVDMSRDVRWSEIIFNLESIIYNNVVFSTGSNIQLYILFKKHFMK